MGVADLETRNISLLLRWWWKPHKKQSSLWTLVATQLRGISRQTDGPILRSSGGSFFWRHLIKIKHIFNWSTQWRIGNGSTISFWYDAWWGAPLRTLRDGLPRPLHQNSSLGEALAIQPHLAPNMSDQFQVQLNGSEDELFWRWTSHGGYTAGSVYRMILSGGRMKWGYMRAWLCKAPPKVKFFVFLALKGRILTHDLMMRRGISCEMKCVMCSSCSCETAFHLLFECTYAVLVWDFLMMHLGHRLMELGESVQDTWIKSWRVSKALGIDSCSSWATRFTATMWFIWRERNEIIFRGKCLPARILVERILEESALWVQYCKGRNK